MNPKKILDSLLYPFDESHFHDLILPLSLGALVLLVVAVVLYNVQMQRLHRHPPLQTLQEWMLWTAICVFGLILVEAIFHFYFVTVLLTLGIGLATFIWVRFFRFPPMIAMYNQQLRRARFFSQSRYRHPEATVRARKATRTKRRRR